MVAASKVWKNGAWVDVAGGGLSAASVSGVVADTPITGSFTDSNGVTWNYYKFIGSGSISFDNAGYADILVVGGGGGSIDYGAGRYTGGGAGAVRYGSHPVEATSYNIFIGAGGSGLSGEGTAGDGGDSYFGSLIIAGGGQGAQSPGSTKDGVDYGGGDGARSYSGATNFIKYGGGAGSGLNGLTLNYDGTSREYGRGGSYDSVIANQGWGGDANGSKTGSSGVVIVKVVA